MHNVYHWTVFRFKLKGKTVKKNSKLSLPLNMSSGGAPVLHFVQCTGSFFRKCTFLKNLLVKKQKKASSKYLKKNPAKL